MTPIYLSDILKEGSKALPCSEEVLARLRAGRSTSALVHNFFLLKSREVNLPQQVKTSHIQALIDNGYAFLASKNPYQAMRELAQVTDKLCILPATHRFAETLNNAVQKTFDFAHYLEMSHSSVVRATLAHAFNHDQRLLSAFEQSYGIPASRVGNLTEELCRQAQLRPESLIDQAFHLHSVKVAKDAQTPCPIGLYWLPSATDGRIRALTLLRNHLGYEKYSRWRAGKFNLGLNANPSENKPFYGHSVTTTIPSESKKTPYSVQLDRLPIFRYGEPDDYSAWMNVASTDKTLDAHYRARAHQKRQIPAILFTSNAVSLYFATAYLTNISKDFSRMTQNPFGLLTNHGMDTALSLLTRTLVLSDGTDASRIRDLPRPLNHLEIDRLLCAECTNTGYLANFRHGKYDKHQADSMTMKCVPQ